MSQKYVTDGAWLVCSEGKMMQKLKVDSQTTIYMHGKLAATEYDRTGENFNCLKMTMTAAIIGAVIAAAAIAATLLTGGAFIGVMAAVSSIGYAYMAGAAVGSALSLMPCICNLLTKPSDWTKPHDKVLLEGKQALLENATLSCLLGGLVSIIKTNIKTAIDMAMLSNHIYDEGAEIPEGWSVVPGNEYPPGLRIKDLWVDEKSNFYARLYQGPDGSYAVVFRGTQPLKLEDWQNNAEQAVGFKSDQYTNTYKLAQQIKFFLPSDKTTIAGHSLGGGKAALAGAETGFPTYTYNAAGLHERTLKAHHLCIEDTQHVQAIGSDDDPLSMMQDNRDLIGAAFKLGGKGGKLVGGAIKYDGALPRATGQRIGLNTDVSRLDLLTGHSIPPLVEILKNEEKQSPDIKIITENKK